jgi:hypothetical protein
MNLLNGGIRLLVALIVFLAINFAIFSSGFYTKFLSASSMQGNAFYTFKAAKNSLSNNSRDVLIIGDSRITEGFNAGTANQAIKKEGLNFLNAGIGGATLRIWNYYLKEIDPHTNRYKYVIVTLPTFRNSVPYDGGYEGRILDADFLVPILDPIKFLDFIGYQTGNLNKFKLINRVVIPSINYGDDFKDLLLHPHNRVTGFKWRMTAGLNYADGYSGNSQNMIGLAFDPNKKLIAYPERLNNLQRDQILRYVENVNNKSPQQAAEAANYLNLWLGKIIERYRNSDTKIILIRLPSTPLPNLLKDKSYPTLKVIQENINSENVIIFPEEYFLDIESADNFWDMHHLNHAGRAKLTSEISKKMQQLEKYK